MKNGSVFNIPIICVCLCLCILLQKIQCQFLINRFDVDIPVFDFVTANGIPYQNCGGTESELKTVNITHCDISDVHACMIKRGSNVTFEMSFVSKVNTNTLQAKIYGVKDWIPLPLPCPQPDACIDSGLICPIEIGNMYNYKVSAPVKVNYPKMSLLVKGELIDDNGNVLICVKVPIKIK